MRTLALIPPVNENYFVSIQDTETKETFHLTDDDIHTLSDLTDYTILNVDDEIDELISVYGEKVYSDSDNYSYAKKDIKALSYFSHTGNNFVIQWEDRQFYGIDGFIVQNHNFIDGINAFQETLNTILESYLSKIKSQAV